MNAASIVLRDAMQAFVAGFTEAATAIDADRLRDKLAHVFPAAAPIDRKLLERMLRAVGFARGLEPVDHPARIWRRVARPEEVPF